MLIVLFLIIGSSSGILLYYAVQSVKNQKAQASVIKLDYNTSSTLSMKKLKKFSINNDLNILAYVLQMYVKEFETYHETKNANYAFLQKRHVLSQYSAKPILNKLDQMFKEQYYSILSNNGFQKAEITGITFIEPYQSKMDKILSYILPSAIPNEALVTVRLYTLKEGKLLSRIRNIKVKAIFRPIKKLGEDQHSSIKFAVISYEYL